MKDKERVISLLPHLKLKSIAEITGISYPMCVYYAQQDVNYSQGQYKAKCINPYSNRNRTNIKIYNNEQ